MYSEPRGGRIVFTACLCLAALIASCDFPFQTREAEVPTVIGDNPVLPLTPQDVLINMKIAVDGRNPAVYEENLSSSFHFRPDPADSAEVEKYYPGAYADWTFKVEAAVMGYILDPIRCNYANLTFDDEVIVDFTDTTYILQEDYILIIKHGDFADYKGTLRFFMKKQPDGYWYIERWHDFLNENQDPTWGRLKGETRARM
jgi:hypothetical protein